MSNETRKQPVVGEITIQGAKGALTIQKGIDTGGNQYTNFFTENGLEYTSMPSVQVVTVNGQQYGLPSLPATPTTQATEATPTVQTPLNTGKPRSLEQEVGGVIASFLTIGVVIMGTLIYFDGDTKRVDDDTQPTPTTINEPPHTRSRLLQLILGDYGLPQTSTPATKASEKTAPTATPASSPQETPGEQTVSGVPVPIKAYAEFVQSGKVGYFYYCEEQGGNSLPDYAASIELANPIQNPNLIRKLAYFFGFREPISAVVRVTRDIRQGVNTVDEVCTKEGCAKVKAPYPFNRFDSGALPPASELGVLCQIGPTMAELTEKNSKAVTQIDGSSPTSEAPIPNTTNPSDVPADIKLKDCYKIGADTPPMYNSVSTVSHPAALADWEVWLADKISETGGAIPREFDGIVYAYDPHGNLLRVCNQNRCLDEGSKPDTHPYDPTDITEVCFDRKASAGGPKVSPSPSRPRNLDQPPYGNTYRKQPPHQKGHQGQHGPDNFQERLGSVVRRNSLGRN